MPGVTDIVVKLAAIALRRHPEINSRWQDDKIVHLSEINVGFAVDTEAGLLVPVIRAPDRLSLREIAGQARTLIDKARQRRLSVEELRGGTFTVSNLAAYESMPLRRSLTRRRRPFWVSARFGAKRSSSMTTVSYRAKR